LKTFELITEKLLPPDRKINMSAYFFRMLFKFI